MTIVRWARVALRAAWWLPLCMWVACSQDPLAGRRFACEPGVEGQCLPGWWCEPVSGKEYQGVCVRAGESLDLGGGVCPAGTSDSGGICKPTCWTGPCPTGYQKYDGCRCKVAPTGVTQCKVPGQTGLVECSTIQPGQSGYGQDGHFSSGSLMVTDLRDGTVRDDRTGLEWQKDYDLGKTWDQAKTYCSTNQAGLPGSGWRLPDVVELLSLVDYSKGSCPMWPAVFGTTCSWFWTLVQAPWSSSSAFFVSFDNGSVDYSGVGNYGFGVRCVRAGQ